MLLSGELLALSSQRFHLNLVENRRRKQIRSQVLLQVGDSVCSTCSLRTARTFVERGGVERRKSLCLDGRLRSDQWVIATLNYTLSIRLEWPENPPIPTHFYCFVNQIKL